MRAVAVKSGAVKSKGVWLAFIPNMLIKTIKRPLSKLMAFLHVSKIWVVVFVSNKHLSKYVQIFSIAVQPI